MAPLPGRPHPTADPETILDLFERFGAHHYDEELSQRDHALQCAALARCDDAGDALVAAALLHDVGHLLELRGRAPGAQPAADHRSHETVGAAFLATRFAPDVVAPVALHVTAKRYLCAVEPAYAEVLSEGSARSLRRQGGPLAPAAIEAFGRSPYHDAAVAQRRWDDRGKVPGLEVAPLEDHRDLLERLTASTAS